jgi:hypothetical protein
MVTHLDISALLVTASCAKGASCPWWTSDMGPSPQFIWGVFLGLIGLAILAFSTCPRMAFDPRVLDVSQDGFRSPRSRRHVRSETKGSGSCIPSRGSRTLGVV